MGAVRLFTHTDPADQLVAVAHHCEGGATNVVGVFDIDAQGKIVWWREYWDGLDCAGQLGIDDKAMRAIMCA